MLFTLERDSHIQETDQRYKLLFDNSVDGIAIWDVSMKIRQVNKALQKLSGYSEAEFSRLSLLNLLTPLSQDIVKERRDLLFANNELKPAEVELITNYGKIIPVEVNSKRIECDGNTCILSHIRDISERKNLEHRINQIMVETEERERERISVQLHDDLGPLLSTMKIYIESLSQDMPIKDKQEAKSRVLHLCKEAINTTREISNNLSPNVLTHYGLSPAIENIIKRQPDDYLISFSNNLFNKRFMQMEEMVIYRIVYELLHNSIRHGKPKNIYIQLQLKDNVLSLSFKDDGCGFDLLESEIKNFEGIGLKNILHRVKLLRAHYSIKSKKGKGFYFEMKAPVILIENSNG